MFKQSLIILFWFILGGVLPLQAQFGIAKIEHDLFTYGPKLSFESKPHFNRVEGFFLHAGIKFKIASIKTMAFAQGGYGLKNEQARYDIGMYKYFLKGNSLVLGSSLFDATTTNDGWMISQIENSLAGVFLREDFYNYFYTQGWRIFIDRTFCHNHTIRLEYADYKYRDMAAFSNFAGTLFGGKKVFRVNPCIIPGNEMSIKLSLILDWRDSELFTISGWYFEGFFKTTTGDFNGVGKVDTDGLFIIGKRYQPTWGNQRFVAKAMLGLRKGSVLPQHLMWIGGVGSLRGLLDRIAVGQNFALLSFNYLFEGDLLQRVPLHFVPLFDTLTMGLFFDIGNAWRPVATKSNLFDGLNGFNPYSDAGVSLVISDGVFRVDFSRRLNSIDHPWRVTIRMLEKL